MNRRDICTLREFIWEYFTLKFPTRTLSILLLKDFLFTLSQQFRENPRFDYFMDLAGLAEIKHRTGVDTATFIQSNKIRLECFQLPDTIRFFMKLCFEVKTGKKTKSDFFLPNHDLNHNNLVPLGEATKIIEDILKSENFEPSRIKEALDEID